MRRVGVTRGVGREQERSKDSMTYPIQSISDVNSLLLA
jgi:hypothetical protein